MTETTDSETAVERLMSKRDDLSREEAKEIVADVQADEDIATVCADCGGTEETRKAVVSATDPSDGWRRALCDECHSQLLKEHTILTPTQSEIYPLLLAGWRNVEIADELGMAASNVAVQKSNIKSKRDEAIEQIEEAERTLAVLKHYDQ